MPITDDALTGAMIEADTYLLLYRFLTAPAPKAPGPGAGRGLSRKRR